MSGVGVDSGREIVANPELPKPPSAAMEHPDNDQYCAIPSRPLYMCIQKRVYQDTRANRRKKRVGGDYYTWCFMKKHAVHELAKKDDFFTKQKCG